MAESTGIEPKVNSVGDADPVLEEYMAKYIPLCLRACVELGEITTKLGGIEKPILDLIIEENTARFLKLKPFLPIGEVLAICGISDPKLTETVSYEGNGRPFYVLEATNLIDLGEGDEQEKKDVKNGKSMFDIDKIKLLRDELLASELTKSPLYYERIYKILMDAYGEDKVDELTDEEMDLAISNLPELIKERSNEFDIRFIKTLPAKLLILELWLKGMSALNIARVYSYTNTYIYGMLKKMSKDFSPRISLDDLLTSRTGKPDQQVTLDEASIQNSVPTADEGEIVAEVADLERREREAQDLGIDVVEQEASVDAAEECDEPDEDDEDNKDRITRSPQLPVSPIPPKKPKKLSELQEQIAAFTHQAGSDHRPYVETPSKVESDKKLSVTDITDEQLLSIIYSREEDTPIGVIIAAVRENKQLDSNFRDRLTERLDMLVWQGKLKRVSLGIYEPNGFKRHNGDNQGFRPDLESEGIFNSQGQKGGSFRRKSKKNLASKQ